MGVSARYCCVFQIFGARVARAMGVSARYCCVFQIFEARYIASVSAGDGRKCMILLRFSGFRGAGPLFGVARAEKPAYRK